MELGERGERADRDGGMRRRKEWKRKRREGRQGWRDEEKTGRRRESRQGWRDERSWEREERGPKGIEG